MPAAAAAPYLSSGSPTPWRNFPPTPIPLPPLLKNLSPQLRSLPDGRHVVSVGEDGLARVWDAGSGTAVRTMSGHDDAGIIFLATSQDGSTAVTGEGADSSRAERGGWAWGRGWWHAFRTRGMPLQLNGYPS